MGIPPEYTLESGNIDTRATATALPLTEDPDGSGYWVVRGLGSVHPASEQDWWRFEALAGDLISVNPNPTDVSVARVDISTTARYYAVVLAFEGEGPFGQYVLDVTIAPTGELQFADLSVTAISVPEEAASGETIAVQWNIGPYDMQISLANGVARLADDHASLAALGESPDTKLWAVVYDIEDNNHIDFGDFSFFAAAFGKSVGEFTSEAPYVWWADFDKSGRVDFGDLAFFAPNFGKTRLAVQSGEQTLVFPSNFPDNWRAPANGGGEGESNGGGEGESVYSAWMAAGLESPNRLSLPPLEHGPGLEQAPSAVLPRKESAITDSTPWLTSGGRKSPPDETLARHTRRRPADNGRDDHVLDRWDPLEDVLSLLAERSSGRRGDAAWDRYDTVFALLG